MKALNGKAHGIKIALFSALFIALFTVAAAAAVPARASALVLSKPYAVLGIWGETGSGGN
jgi:hypothetical protein